MRFQYISAEKKQPFSYQHNRTNWCFDQWKKFTSLDTEEEKLVMSLQGTKRRGNPQIK